MITELPEDMDDAKFNTFLLSKDLKCIACRANYAKQYVFLIFKSPSLLFKKPLCRYCNFHWTILKVDTKQSPHPQIIF